MKINMVNPNKVVFGVLEPGEVFSCGTSSFYMRIETDDLKENNAVNISNGKKAFFDTLEEVVIKNVTLNIMEA